METFSVTQTSRLIGKAPNTVRTWSSPDLFGRFLSSSANPEPGGERRYSEEDIRILKTAVILQKQGLSIPEIIPRIASGEILEELPGEEDSVPPGSRLSGIPRNDIGSQMELFIRPYESQISRLAADLERGRGELEEERNKRIAAELELSRLSAILEERSQTWYKRLFGR